MRVGYFPVPSIDATGRAHLALLLADGHGCFLPSRSTLQSGALQSDSEDSRGGCQALRIALWEVSMQYLIDSI